MIETEDYVEPLSGEEIVLDCCTQLAEKLRADCNLRPSDAYSGGYYAKITIHLEAYGMDVSTVDTQFTAGKQQDNPDELLQTELEIPVEPALNMVRKRSDQPVPTLSDEGGEPQVHQRRYVRGAQKVQGGGEAG
jgi:hypothetical protein